MKERMNLKYSMKIMLKKSSNQQSQQISRIPKCARCRNHGIIRCRCIILQCWIIKNLKAFEILQWITWAQENLHLQELPMPEMWFDLWTTANHGCAGKLQKILKVHELIENACSCCKIVLGWCEVAPSFVERISKTRMQAHSKQVFPLNLDCVYWSPFCLEFYLKVLLKEILCKTLNSQTF